MRHVLLGGIVFLGTIAIAAQVMGALLHPASVSPAAAPSATTRGPVDQEALGYRATAVTGGLWIHGLDVGELTRTLESSAGMHCSAASLPPQMLEWQTVCETKPTPTPPPQNAITGSARVTIFGPDGQHVGRIEVVGTGDWGQIVPQLVVMTPSDGADTRRNGDWASACTHKIDVEMDANSGATYGTQTRLGSIGVVLWGGVRQGWRTFWMHIVGVGAYPDMERIWARGRYTLDPPPYQFDLTCPDGYAGPAPKAVETPRAAPEILAYLQYMQPRLADIEDALRTHRAQADQAAVNPRVIAAESWSLRTYRAGVVLFQKGREIQQYRPVPVASDGLNGRLAAFGAELEKHAFDYPDSAWPEQTRQRMDNWTRYLDSALPRLREIQAEIGRLAAK